MKISSTAKDEHTLMAERILRARRSIRLSQTALAKRVGVTPSAVAQWEHPGGTAPSLQHLRSIAIATFVDFQWLATGRGHQRPLHSEPEEETPALKLDLFAQDVAEEVLLQRFRALSPRGRQLVSTLLEELNARRTMRTNR